jgi:putative glutamine amidotransferase
MVDKVYHMTNASSFKALNKTESEKPIIGICFDWRKDPVTQNYGYVSNIIQDYKLAIENAGGEPFILSFDDDISQVKDTLDGYIIPGGRDIHPKFYGQEVNGAMISETAETHYQFNERVYHGLPSACPILGICWGFQFLNVVTGGTMVQDLHDKVEHFKRREMKLFKDSWLHEVVGSTAHGNCYHHQGLDKLGKNVVATAVDDISKIVHAIEVREPGRDINGILWHPEITYTNESREVHLPDSRKIFNAFVKKCETYKRSKLRRSN